MKKLISMLLVVVMVLSLAACGAPAAAPTTTEATADVAMQYITPEDAKEKLEDSGYVFFDLRKTEDSSKTTIPGAQAWDMDAAKEGDAEAGKATMTKATEGLDKNIILVCYSGKRYAQATTNALSAIGYDMSKVYTLEGGFKAWSEKFPELCVAPEAAETVEATETVAADEMSDTVKALYEQFDEAMLKQLGTLPEAGSSDVKVGAVIISLTNAFWSNMKDCYEAAGEELGIKVDVQTGTTEGDTASQLDVLMTMADMDYDVIIVSPIDGTNLIPGIVKCNKNGIKVINLGPGVDIAALEEAGGHLDAKITVEFTEQGDKVAKDMMARLPDGGKVAVLAGLAGAGQSEGRTKGFVDAIAADSKYELVTVQNCDWDATLAYDATKALIAENPDLKGIFCCNDTMALAAVEALAAEGKSDVYVYGVDFTNDAREAIIAGTMTGSMSYSSARYTKAALQMAMKLHEGYVFDSFVYLPLTLVNVDNVTNLNGWK